MTLKVEIKGDVNDPLFEGGKGGKLPPNASFSNVRILSSKYSKKKQVIKCEVKVKSDWGKCLKINIPCTVKSRIYVKSFYEVLIFIFLDKSSLFVQML